MKKLLVILLCLGLAGCATINKTMESWMGANANDLIASWGPPQQTMSDGQGGQILVYSSARTWTTPGQATTTTTGYANSYGDGYYGHAYGNARSTTTYTPPQTSGYDAQRMFWVDRNGRIYRWAWKGL